MEPFVSDPHQLSLAHTVHLNANSIIFMSLHDIVIVARVHGVCRPEGAHCVSILRDIVRIWEYCGSNW